MIEDEPDLSLDEMTELQLDDRNPMAATLVPFLLDVELPEGYYSDGQELMAGWDFTQPPESAAAAYYNVVWRNLLELTFHDDLPEAAWPDGGQRWMAVVEGLLRDPDDPFWDDRTTEDEVETRDDVLVEAQLQARDEITARQDRNPQEWSWGHLHQLDLVHPTLGASGVAPVEWLFNRGGWEVGGGGSIVDATVVGRPRGLRRHRRPLDADGGEHGRPRRLPVDQPHRRLRPPVPRPLRRPDRPLGRGRVPPLAVLPEAVEAAARTSSPWSRARPTDPVDGSLPCAGLESAPGRRRTRRRSMCRPRGSGRGVGVGAHARLPARLRATRRAGTSTRRAGDSTRGAGDSSRWEGVAGRRSG